MLVFDMPLERLPPLVLSSTDGARVDVISVHILVCDEVLPAGESLTAGVTGEGGRCIVETLVGVGMVLAREALVADGT